ncbi:hypothetical protein N7457_008940 [Penicillium paradoxum]|uniref:uncharacterized protein n=1 Tax=Penicillium paradoxum TaxID=176176 RepID=UPI0025472E49|nr:uncharacterized protein N7457_008940 [Penicillium paradoxum]KAJ5774044.1 hypothetical protein N7457_008940 [Penicillium paradoxum]
MVSSTKVTLFPWDANSVVHRKRLVEQRIECSWHQDEVETKWRTQQIKGEKCIYWIVLVSDEQQARSKVKKPTITLTKAQLTHFHKGEEMLQDTATTLNAVPCQPTQESFVPIGHISLDSKNPEADNLDLDLPSQNIFWIKSFYVRQSIQGQGIGRAAMDEVEAMAGREPLLAKTLMLDTVHSDDQKREDFAIATFGGVPKTTNQEWYNRRGYRLIKTLQNFYRVSDRNGKMWDMRTVFMRKDLAGDEGIPSEDVQ